MSDKSKNNHYSLMESHMENMTANSPFTILTLIAIHTHTYSHTWLLMH